MGGEAKIDDSTTKKKRRKSKEEDREEVDRMVRGEVPVVLNRPLESLSISRILFMMSSSDRGQRAANYGGDKLELMTRIFHEAAELCNEG